MQTGEYIEFIDRLVESANIMNKNFYCVIPYSESITPASGGFLSKLFSSGAVTKIAQREENFEKVRVVLDERVSSISSNLASIGLRVVRLATDQLIELVYGSYNFAAAPDIDASQLENITITEEQP
jgi:hypothetical protein